MEQINKYYKEEKINYMIDSLSMNFSDLPKEYIEQAKKYYLNDDRPFDEIKNEIMNQIHRLSLMEKLVSQNIDPNVAQNSILLIGPMGAGKSTIANIISTTLNIPQISLDNRKQLNEFYSNEKSFNNFDVLCALSIFGQSGRLNFRRLQIGFYSEGIQNDIEAYLSYINDDEILQQTLKDIANNLQSQGFFSLAEKYLTLAIISYLPSRNPRFRSLLPLQRSCNSPSLCLLGPHQRSFPYALRGFSSLRPLSSEAPCWLL